MNRSYKITALILAVCMLTGCAGFEETINSVRKLSEASIGAKWVNSSIEGVIDENTNTSPQDDYYTYVNKDWILAQQLDKSEQKVDLFEPDRIVYDRKIKLMEDPESTGYFENTQVGLSRSELEHAGEIVSAFTKAAEDVKGRNEKGVEPVREYIEAIEKIDSIPELTEFILDFNGMNLAGAPLINFYVDNLVQDMGSYHVIARPISIQQLSLRDVYAYENISPEAIIQKQENSAIVRNILEKLGYETAEIKDILRRAYRLEIRLAEKMCSDTQIGLNDYEEEHCEIHTLAELSELTGDYPSEEILKAYGYDSNEAAVFEPEYMQRIAEIYSEDHLDELKAYYIMKTIYAVCDLLDMETHEEVNYILARGYEEEEDPLNPDSPEVRKKKQFLADYLEQYVRAPFEMMYIGAYCDPEEKELITALAQDVKTQLREVLANEEWLSETGRKNAVDKLDNMQLKVLYPDKYFSYEGLDIHEGMSLLEMARNAAFFDKCRQSQLVGKAYDRSMWDLNIMPTTAINAYNEITSNSMVILAGYVAGNITFDPNGRYEVNLAKLGTTIGHEMTHGFDDHGYGYDRTGRHIDYGDENAMLTSEDTAELLKRSVNLIAAFSTISPMPGVETYNGSISGEAIADMGGMKTAIMAAETKADFDYDLFFRSYAELWRKKVSRKIEKIYVQADEHPIANLRTNVTLQQFDRFMETYDIKPGDGMYLAPENRITVW